MSLGEMVLELEDDFERLKDECRNLEQSVDEVESELEDVTNQLNKANEFREWVQLVYPEIVRDYESVKVIEEIAHEHS